MGWFFDRKDPKNELEAIDKAQRILDERYKMGQVLPEVYQKQCMEFQKRREKYAKKVKKD